MCILRGMADKEKIIIIIDTGRGGFVTSECFARLQVFHREDDGLPAVCVVGFKGNIAVFERSFETMAGAKPFINECRRAKGLVELP